MVEYTQSQAMSVQIIVNTKASLFSRNPELLRGMKAVAKGHGLFLTSSLEELTSASNRIAQSSASLVVLCGGDGTASSGVTSLLQAFGNQPLPTLCLAPGGGFCTVARNWGRLHRDPRHHLEEVLKQHDSKQLSVFDRPTLEVHDDAGSRFGFIFGAGLIASFFEAFYERRRRGYRDAAWMIGRIFLGSFVDGSLARRVLSPTRCALWVDGRRHPGEALTLVVAAVVPNLGLGLRVTHRGGEDPMRPHLVASSLTPFECGLQYHRVLRGLPLNHRHSIDRLVAEFSIEFPLTNHYQLDGELLSCTQVTVKAGPRIRIASLAR